MWIDRKIYERDEQVLINVCKENGKLREEVRALREEDKPTNTLQQDMRFVACMLHTAVVTNRMTSDFHVCEAWEIAKKYMPVVEEKILCQE